MKKLTEEYEKKLKDQEIEHDANLKIMAKEMNIQITEKEQSYQQQLQDYMRKLFYFEKNDIL